MRRTLLAAAMLTLFATPALAYHCPADIAAIDNALPKVSLSAEQKAQVERLRDEGEELHNAGSHGEAVNKLAEAMRIILNNL